MTACFKWMACGLCLFALATGCRKPAGTNGNSAAGDDPEAGTAIPNTADGKPAKKLIPFNREVKDFPGNWVVTVTLGAADRYTYLIKLSREADGKTKGEIIDLPANEPETKIEELTLEDKLLRFKAKNAQASLDYEGLFDGRAFRGTIEINGTQIFPARLLSTNESSMKDFAESQLPPGTDVYQKTIESMKQQRIDPKQIYKVAADYRESPLTLDALSAMVIMLVKEVGNDDLLRESISEYLKTVPIWGPRMNGRGEMVVAEQLILNRRLTFDSLKHLDAAESLLKGRLVEASQERIKALREIAQVQLSIEKSQSAAEEDRAAAYIELKDALSRQPFNHEILLALATRTEQTKQSDEAIGYLTDIVALPLLERMILEQRAGKPPVGPTPGESLRKLWVEKHGDDGKLMEHVLSTQAKKLNAWIDEVRTKGVATPPSDTSNRAVLVELFTGGQCPPCVATDLAVSSLSRAFPTTELVTLRYHQHIPGPDPLVNQDAEDRFAVYEGASTPTVVIDGLVVDSTRVPYTGPLQMATNAYNNLRQIIDSRRKLASKISITAEAAVVNGELSLKAEATGATEEQLPNLRLRMAIAEEVVSCFMPNGLFQHEMVVREMPGGARGIPAKKGELKYSFSMPIDDIQRHVDEHLQRFETGNKLSFPKEMKPRINGRLFLVAWVQSDKIDDKNLIREVHQTLIVPVKGLEGSSDTTIADMLPKSGGSAAQGESKERAVQPPAPALPE